MLNDLLWVMQVAIGIFFGISGFFKLFNKGRHSTLVHTLQDDHVPFVYLMQWLVPLTEFIGGVLLALGLWSFFSAGALLVVTLGACFLDAPRRVDEMQPINVFDSIDDWLYLCETWLVLALLITMTNNLEDLSWMMQLL